MREDAERGDKETEGDRNPLTETQRTEQKRERVKTRSHNRAKQET